MVNICIRFVLFVILCAVGVKGVSAQSFQDYKKASENRFSNYENEFEDYKTKLNKEFEQFKKIYDTEFIKFTDSVYKIWADRLVSDNKIWVEYSPDMKTRRIINFETGEITIQIKDENADNIKLATELANFITEDVSAANRNDLLSANVEAKLKDAGIKAESSEAPKGAPIILSMVSNSINTTAKGVAKVAADLMKQGTTKLETLSNGDKAITLTTSVVVEQEQLPQVSGSAALTANTSVGKIHKKAGDYKNLVKQYAADRKMPEALVYAVIHNESSFNPKAVSHVPAYGLMQLVPKSGGAEAASVYFGKQVVLAPSYFYNPENNIKLGATYLSQLYYNYFKGIKNPEVRLYCTICAYNTGPGNVSRAFIGSTKLGNAISVINEKSPQEAYNILLNKLPYEETRNYLKKVSSSYNAYYGYK